MQLVQYIEGFFNLAPVFPSLQQFLLGIISEAVFADLQRRLGPVNTVPRRASSFMVPVLLASKSVHGGKMSKDVESGDGTRVLPSKTSPGAS